MNKFQIEQDLDGGFSNKKAVGKLPDPLPDVLLLNLGCGKDIRDGFINMDLYSDDPRVVAMDVRKLDLPAQCVDAILASDILEHFSHREIQNILSEWYRVLKPGGELIIRCPSLKLQMQAYQRGDWDADVASYMIFGGQTNPGDYHCIAFDNDSITKRLNSIGFDVYDIQEQDIPQNNGLINLNMIVRSRKSISEEIVPHNSQENDTATEILPSFDKIDEDEFDFLFGERTNVNNNDETEFDGFFNIDLFNEMLNYGESSIDEVQELNVHSQTMENFNYDDNEIKDIEQKPVLNIVWEGSQFVFHSFALINREHCLNLSKTDLVNLTLVPYEKEEFDAQTNKNFLPLIQNDLRFKADVDEQVAKLPYVWIRHQWPPKADAPKGAKWFIMQPWEFTSHRKDFIEIFKQADEIWTPSDYSRRSFINSGIDFNKVQVIPNGINPTIFKPQGEVFPLNTDKKLKLLYMGGTIYRKGFDILLNVYSRLFNSDDDICLVIKDLGGDSFYKGQTAKENIEELKLIPNAPEIIYIDEKLSDEEIASLYRACNVFVSPYRGEGFSLPTLEAMACGLTVVVTKGGSTDEFVQPDFCYQINSELKSIGNYIGENELTEEGFLLEPDIMELATVLKKIYEEPAYVYSDGLVSSFFARNNFTWNKSTLKLLSRLDFFYNTDLSSNAKNILVDIPDAELTVAQAELLYRVGEFEQAKLLFNSLIEEGSLSGKLLLHTLLRLSMLEINDEKIAQAEELIKKCENIQKDYYDTKYVKVLVKLNQDKDLDCLELLTDLIENKKNFRTESTLGFFLDDLLVLLGDIFLKMEDLEAANKIYTQALKYNPENPYACYGSAIVFHKAGINESAIEMLEWTLKLDPQFSDAQSLLKQLSNN